jgi:hypothetical protein
LEPLALAGSAHHETQGSGLERRNNVSLEEQEIERLKTIAENMFSAWMDERGVDPIEADEMLRAWIQWEPITERVKNLKALLSV